MANSQDRVGIDALVTYFQPFYNLSTAGLQGFEALARARSNDDSRAPSPANPAVASPQTDLRELDLWILNDALPHLQDWRSEAGHEGLILSLNLSWEFVDHPNFAGDILDALYRHSVPGHRLLVDLPAQVFRRLRPDGPRATQLRRLQEREITFCIDGFTGDDLDLLNCPLATSVDIVKAHPAQLTGPREALEQIVTAVHDAGLPVVVAGVETPEHLALLRELEVEWAQGFLLGEPEEAARALERSAARLSL
ncbi:EAL domain-containing protein (putative c-di-GMP-specific phosphodiesterase class I) [Kineosphaera limosa]|uniref:EAL domain-containing protein n=1 Tax=Kineosphaera limosa NBRC 100340 TaxID=1184609 RepID=K6VLP3_9MICO|nr:EAL domain-containing protein [Kineosphaera limosa]NYE00345.1 EAL domain-containing protein (putative c-di-GMP-specific phosphodiesterase class I) [Kineosphaera limosa]GAB97143.1 hypothetical protein KILIM_057_00340 [Kineosphaera limosa NBRC 100340]